MTIITPIIVIALLAAVVWFVGQPLRARAADQDDRRDEGRIADLEAARDAKYRQIRDLEMDHLTGKLSDQDWRSLDRELRAEAVDLLSQLDQLAVPAEADRGATS